MIRFGRFNLALALLLVLPTVVSAQRDSRYTREASKFLGLAMTRQDAAQRTDMYQQALTHLREGMERDGDNAKVWLLAGTVYAALGEMVEADRAFVKAVQMHPAYAEEIDSEREAAWIDAFNRGVDLMDEQRYDEAIAVMEASQVIYTQRPEALMNLGALYANRGETDKALKSFEDAIEATRGPLYGKLDAEQQQSWTRMRDMAKLNIAQMSAAAGVEAFEAEDYVQAEEHFRRASEINPHARDYYFNYAQAIWAQASALEDALEGNDANAAEAKEKLPGLYTRIEELALKLRAMDPNNEAMYIIEARSKRMRNQLAGNAEAGQQAALKLLQDHDALAVGVDDIQIYADGDGLAITGRMKNRKAAEGAPIRIEFTLVGTDGKEIGREFVTVNAPAPEEDTVFRGRSAATGELAGWTYRVLN
jgi:Flp pilus assembly protein TadD